MQITINGEMRELSENLTISGMLENLKLPAERIAIELNREVIRKKDWASVRLNDADKIEIIHFVGGGWIDYELKIKNYDMRIEFTSVRIPFASFFAKIEYTKLIFVIRKIRNYLWQIHSF